MGDILDKVILDNTVRNYLIVAGIILLALAFKRVVSRFSADVFLWVMRRAGRQIDRGTFQELVLGPVEAFLFDRRDETLDQSVRVRRAAV